MFEFMTVRELYEICRADNAVETDNVEYVELEGWVRTNRDSGKLGFIALNDGSYFRNCQVVYLEEKLNFYKINTQGYSMNLVEEILQKYKSIIGGKHE